MKYTLLLLMLSLLFFSCKKEDEVTNAKKSIIGTWELEKNECGYCTTPVTNYAPGNKNILIFSMDNKMITMRADTVVKTYGYEIQNFTTCNPSGVLALKFSENMYISEQLLDFPGNNLKISTTNCVSDGSVSTYRRIQ